MEQVERRVVKCFISKEGNTEEAKRFEYRMPFVEYVLYSDNTWEKMIVFDGDYWNNPHNKGCCNLTSRIKGKTRNEAIEIVEKLIFCENKLDGHLLV